MTSRNCRHGFSRTDETGIYHNRLDTGAAIDACQIADADTQRIAFKLIDRQYARRFKRSLAADSGERKTSRKKKVTLPTLGFLARPELA